MNLFVQVSDREFMYYFVVSILQRSAVKRYLPERPPLSSVPAATVELRVDVGEDNPLMDS